MALILILATGILKIGAAPYIAFAFAGASLIFWGAKPRIGEVSSWLALAGVFGLIYRLQHGAQIA